MKRTKQELEVFDKMFVDKFNKQKEELDRLKEAYKVLKKKYDKDLIDIETFTEQIDKLNKDLKQSEAYKQLKAKNKSLILDIRKLYQVRDNLMQKLLQYERD